MSLRALGLPAALAMLGWSGAASATYSIVATDPASGRFGAAGASCVPYEVIRIAQAAKGGVLVAQAEFDDAALAEGTRLLAEGKPAAEILAVITEPAAFPQAPKMQYGIADASGASVSVTGPLAGAIAKDESFSVDGYAASAQGNLLTGAEVIAAMRAGFVGCDLPERLVAALEAAGRDAGGDARCTPRGRPAQSAFLLVATPMGEQLRISVPALESGDPVAQVRERFTAWRRENPCPAPEPPAKQEPRETSTPGGGCTIGPAERDPDWTALGLLGFACLTARASHGRARSGSSPRPGRTRSTRRAGPRP